MNFKAFQGVLFVSGGIGLLASILLFSSGGSDSAFIGLGVFSLILSIVCFVVGGLSVYGSSVSSEAQCFISNSGTLTITNRNPAIAKVVKIKNDSDAIVKYEPVKIHIGAATVGRVTTGGVYTTGGYNYLAGTKKNGKYKLTANNITIFRIQLNEAQYNSAKNSTISKYLNDSHQIQVIDDLHLSEAETTTMFQTLKQSSFMYGGEAMKRGYPSYEKCIEIMNWLCSNDTEQFETTKETMKDKKPITGEWKCPSCGKYNRDVIPFCSCGQIKP